MVAWAIDTYGSDAQRAAYLPRLVAMEAFGSYCLTEPGAGSDAASLATRAALTPDGRHYVLNGSKAFISGGGRSDVYLVMARTGGPGAGGVSAFLVDAGTPGLTYGAQERKVGWNSQPTAAVFLENVTVPASARLAGEGDGFRIAMRALNGGRLSIAACSLGGAGASLAAAADYVKGRKQFGRPLADFQNTQFTLADMAMSLHAARLTVRHAAGALDGGHPHAAAFCATAKRVATDAGFAVADAAMQLHGGYGYLAGPVERVWRDVRVHRILEGTNEVMRLLVARAVLA
jgi:alkylation response protein AidB-like acyl-CoA dehydrogenase